MEARPSVVWMAMVFALGCEGTISEPGGEPEVVVDAPGGACSPRSADRSPIDQSLRRLNTRELENTIAALLGRPIEAATATLPADAPGRSTLDDPAEWAYDRTGSSQSVGHVHVEAFLQMADAIAAEAIADDTLLDRLMPGCDGSALGPRVRSSASATIGASLEPPPELWKVCYAGVVRNGNLMCPEVTDPDEVKLHQPTGSVRLQHSAVTAGSYRVEVEAAGTGTVDLIIGLDGSLLEQTTVARSDPDARSYTTYTAIADLSAGDHTFVFAQNGLGRVYIRQVSVVGPIATGAPDTAATDACIDAFVESFAPRAWRRPLTAAEKNTARLLIEQGVADGFFFDGLRMALELVLQSPAFLYHVELGAPTARAGWYRLTDHELASRLSYLAWEAPPDDTLRAAAEAGELSTADGLRRQGERLVSDPRARATVRTFYSQWLRLYEIETLTKDVDAFPEFTTAVRDAMRRETEAFLDDMIWERDATLADVLTAPHTILPPELAPLYDVPAPATLEEVSLPPGRLGLLTQPSLLALNSHPNRQSAVRRGVFVMADLLCDPPRSPPVGVDFSAPDSSRAATWRQRLEEFTGAPECRSCHEEMEATGFAFESFDTLGRFRTHEGGEPIDDRAGVVSLCQPPDAFEGPVELATTLAESEAVSTCFTRQWLRFGLGRREISADGATLDALHTALTTEGIRAMLVRLATTESFSHRIVEAELEAAEVQP